MNLFDYNQPNFTTAMQGNGFVSICRSADRRCTASWILGMTKQLVKDGKSSELLEMSGGLPSSFGEDGRSSGFLTIEVLDRIAWQLGYYDTPYNVSVAQGYELAQLAVALLNYDTNHADDETPILCNTHEREIVIDMIKLVHREADQSTLLEDLLEPDTRKLAAKTAGRQLYRAQP